MKTIKIFSLFAVLAMVLTGCIEDDFGMGSGPAKTGDEIIFGGTAGYGSKTRTVYGDKLGTGTEIKWYRGDKVRIYCAQAQPVGSGDAAVQYCDYSVENGLSPETNPNDGVDDDGGESSSLAAIGESGLRWGNTGEQHVFYGVYPAPGQLANESADTLSKMAAGKLKLEGNTLTGYLPNRQTPLGGTNFVQTTNGNYIVHPAMRYAYMVACKPVNPASTSGVSLEFVPIVTAVEITLVNNSIDFENGEGTKVDIVNIQGFRVSSNRVICGDFTTDIEEKTNIVSSTDDTYKQVFIPAKIDKLAYGESVTFTAFMMLDNSVSGLNNLAVTIITASGQKSANLMGKGEESIIVYAKMKNFLSNVPLNLGVVSTTLNASNWIEHIPNTIDGQPVLVRTLSIPGAGGAASYTQYETNREYAQQSLDISGQWNQGVRCFEFATDRPTSNQTFGEQDVVCNGRSTGVKLETAIDEVVNKLKESPKEFAMVIITYENLGGWADAQNVTRSPATFMSELKTFWNKYRDVTALYNPASTTIESARGKLFCIARPTSTGQDDFSYSAGISIGIGASAANVSYDYTKLNIDKNNIHEHILIVNGWGVLKDKWIQRGYTSCLFHRGMKNPSGDITKATGYKTNFLGRPFEIAKDDEIPDTDKVNYTANTEDGKQSNTGVNFYYGTQTYDSGTKKDNTAWVQEWARVSPAGGVYINNDGYFYWAPTIGEKELRISETLDFAINKAKGDILYINSLCGYFISSKYKQSYYPHRLTDKSGHLYSTIFTGKVWCGTEMTGNSSYSGMEGDIDTYAKYINNYFYNLLINKQAAGELNNGIGIVLMDRVSNNEESDPAGFYIPQIIWSSNHFVNE